MKYYLGGFCLASIPHKRYQKTYGFAGEMYNKYKNGRGTFSLSETFVKSNKFVTYRCPLFAWSPEISCSTYPFWVFHMSI